jgi:hypothetical protein
MNPTHVQPLDLASVDEIRTRAYFLWLDRGRPHGQHDAHWLEAEYLQRRAANRLGQPAHATIRVTVATHQSDPVHQYHAPVSDHDDRLNVIAGEAPQRVRGRHGEGSLRSPEKSRV